MRRYPKNKKSGVEWLGDVPEHWEVKQLRYVADLNPSKSEIAVINRETIVSFLPMESIGEDGSLSLEQQRPIGEVEGGYTYVRDGDIVVAKITPCFENGKGAVMCGLVNGIGFGTTELIVARPRPRVAAAPYLHMLFTSGPFRRLGESHMYGAGGQKRVPDAFVRNFTTAFPPVAEQWAIARFLTSETSKIDALIAEQQRLIALLQEKRQAVISHAVTKGLNPDAAMKPSGIEWLGDVPAHWEVLPLKYACSLIKDGTHLPPARVDHGVPLLSVRNIIDGRFVFRDDDSLISPESYEALCRSFVPLAGDVLLAIVGATLGKTAVIPDRLGSFHVQRSVAVLRPRVGAVSSTFLHFIFQSTGFQSLLWQLVGYSAQPGIYLQTLADIRVAVPALPEQEEIWRVVQAQTDAVDLLVSEADRAIALLQERRTALISAAVTGKIDVRNYAAGEAA